MAKQCDKCGVNLQIVDGKLYCPNHGFISIEENNKEDKNKKRSYIN